MMFKSVGTWHAGEGWQTYVVATRGGVAIFTQNTADSTTIMDDRSNADNYFSGLTMDEINALESMPLSGEQSVAGRAHQYAGSVQTSSTPQTDRERASAMSPADLRKYLRGYGVSEAKIKLCVEKSELVDLLMKCNDGLQPDPPSPGASSEKEKEKSPQTDRERAAALSPDDLRKYLRGYGVSEAKIRLCVEKNELVDLLISTYNTGDEAEEELAGADDKPQTKRERAAALSPVDLRKYIRGHGVSEAKIRMCVEKNELVELFLSCTAPTASSDQENEPQQPTSESAAPPVPPAVPTDQQESAVAESAVAPVPAVLTDQQKSAAAESAVAPVPPAPTDQQESAVAESAVAPVPAAPTDQQKSAAAESAVAPVPAAPSDQQESAVAESAAPPVPPVPTDQDSIASALFTLAPPVVAQQQQEEEAAPPVPSLPTDHEHSVPCSLEAHSGYMPTGSYCPHLLYAPLCPLLVLCGADLLSGNDLHVAEMSVAAAKRWCEQHPECAGFTFAGDSIVIASFVAHLMRIVFVLFDFYYIRFLLLCFLLFCLTFYIYYGVLNK
jgi:hypothetical protein